MLVNITKQAFLFPGLCFNFGTFDILSFVLPKLGLVCLYIGHALHFRYAKVDLVVCRLTLRLLEHLITTLQQANLGIIVAVISTNNQ